MAVGFRAAGTVVDSGSTGSTTSPTITVPATVVPADRCLLLVSWVGTAAETPPTMTPDGADWSTVLAPGTYNNMGFSVHTKVGLTASDTFAVVANNARLFTIAHIYYSDVTGFTPVGAVTSRNGVSGATTTAASITTVQTDQLVALLSVERTTATGTTISSVSPSDTTRTFGEGTGTSTNTVYIGDFPQPGAPGATATVTITYNSASGNGAALQLGIQSVLDAELSRTVTTTGAADMTVTASIVSMSLGQTITVERTAEMAVIPRLSAGWQGLLAIRDEWRADRAVEEGPPSACPNDGEPLLSGPDGELYCPFDGWRWRS